MIRHRNQMRLCHRESNEEEIQYYHQPETTEKAQEQETQQLRRSTRISRPPERFVPWWQGKHDPFTIEHDPFTFEHDPFTFEHDPFTFERDPFTFEHDPFTFEHDPFTIEHP
ncbi:hypothetical protein RF11_05456 [Thelohanellus kitauei]|uniref:Uncharacterized protein n=1 Tax=Thelohanellus kitauei TaxID=669202 RepID=A0A0C2JG84_THEKT|nr:hypothetical protein RF11_05456 [Thelohanellus kitauei]